jgi:sulfur-oxidizing protein SoxZ
MAGPPPLVSVPARVKRGDAFEVKTLIAHPMETGYRPGENGTIIPRNIVRRVRCSFAGDEVFDMALSPAVAANPFLVFEVRATRGGTLSVRWSGDNGFEAAYDAEIAVE